MPWNSFQVSEHKAGRRGAMKKNTTFVSDVGGEMVTVVSWNVYMLYMPFGLIRLFANSRS